MLKKLLTSHLHRVVLVVVLLSITIFGFFSEKILDFNGQGPDGARFAEYTAKIPEVIKNHQVDEYYFQRLGIPTVLHGLFSVFHIEFSNPNLTKGYALNNLFFIGLALVFFFLISNKLRFSKTIEIVGFSSLFFCFPILKLSMFYAILMDVPAFSLSVLLFYLYISNRQIMFLLVVLFGAFVYPTFILFSCLLFFKQVTLSTEPIVVELADAKPKERFNVLQILTCFSFAILTCYISYTYVMGNNLESIVLAFKYSFSKTLLMWLSLILALSFLIMFSFYRAQTFSFSKIIRSVNVSGIVGGVLVLIVSRLIIKTFSSDSPSFLTLQTYLSNIAHQALQNPLNFLIAHVFYFGLIPLLCIFILKSFKKEVLNFGFGMIVFLNLIWFFSIGSESRQLINYFPIIVFVTLIALNKHWDIKMGFAVLFVCISLGLSHFWFKINTPAMYNAVSGYDSHLLPHFQRYFRFQGPWVSNYTYKIHLYTCIVLAFLLFVLIKKRILISRKREIEIAD